MRNTQIQTTILLLLFLVLVPIKAELQPKISKFGGYTDTLAETFGLSKNRPKVQEIFQDFTLKSLDLNSTSLIQVDSIGDIGIVIEADYDLGFGWKNPWFNDMQYMVIEFIPYFKLGGIFHTALHLYFMRIHIWYDVIGSELQLFNTRIMTDVVEYNEVCYRVSAKN